jgi:hypothetical protein
VPDKGDYVAFPWFWGGAGQTVPVYSVYDLAIVGDDDVTIYDWKTGMRTETAEESARRQLAFYAAFALSYWKAPLDNIEVVVYWPDVPDTTRSDVSEKQMAALAESCDRYHALFLERKRAAYENQVGFIDAMPMTETLSDCARCPFKGCAGQGRLNGLVAEDPAEYDPFADL